MKRSRSSLVLPLTGLLFIAWLVGLWVLSSLPGNELDLPPFSGADKLAHALYFAVGGILLAFLVRGTFGWNAWQVIGTVVLAMTLIGALDEVHQLYTPNRSGADSLDWLADSVGGFLGAVVIGWLHVRASDRSRRPAGKVVAQGD